MIKKVYVFCGGSLLAPSGTPDAEAVCGIQAAKAAALFGGLPDADWFDVPLLPDGPQVRCCTVPLRRLPDGWEPRPVRALLDAAAEDGGGRKAAALLRLCHIAQWRENSRFCGRCGAANGDSPREPARVCPACGRTEYPRISPAVITAVINSSGRILLAHNRQFAPNVYSLIAGFNEAGETLEETVVREAREETGVLLKNIRYLKSQSWPFPDSLMIGFKAEYAGGNIRCDNDEIEDAAFFSRDNLPALPGPASIARQIIEELLQGNSRLELI